MSDTGKKIYDVSPQNGEEISAGAQGLNARSIGPVRDSVTCGPGPGGIEYRNQLWRMKNLEARQSLRAASIRKTEDVGVL